MKQSDAFIPTMVIYDATAAHNKRVFENVLLCIFVRLMHECKRHDLTADRPWIILAVEITPEVTDKMCTHTHTQTHTESK